MRRLGRYFPTAMFLLLALSPTTAWAENADEKVYVPEVPAIKSEPSPQTVERTPRTKPAEAAPDGGESPSEATPPPAHEPQPEKHRRPHPRRHTAPPEQREASPHISDSKPVASIDESPPQTATVAPHKAGGGSSPVVPLLIAVSVLAVISIGVARHRLNR